MKLDALTKEQITVIREALATEMDRLRDKLCTLYNFDDILADAFYNKEGQEDRSNDDSEEV